jgi:hypothetical protein
MLGQRGLGQALGPDGQPLPQAGAAAGNQGGAGAAPEQGASAPALLRAQVRRVRKVPGEEAAARWWT